MENEIRFYLKQIKKAMVEPTEVDGKPFEPQYIVTAVKLPTGAIEIAVNDKEIAGKIDYILDAYDENMCLKTNTSIVMQNIMIV
jgi:hypothetical protein